MAAFPEKWFSRSSHQLDRRPRPAPENTSWKVFFTGDEYFEHLIEDIRKARFSIVFEVYIFVYDSIGKRILEALIEKAEQGVSVRLILDGAGAFPLSQEMLERISDSRVRFHVFRPLHIVSIFRSGMHRRNHRKLSVIDKKVCYIGGMNITDVHSIAVKGDAAWRDTMLRLEGPVARLALLQFEQIWHFVRRGQFIHVSSLMPETPGSKAEILPARISNRHNRPLGDETFTLIGNHTRRRRKEFKKMYIRLLREAKTSIYITSPYFIPRLLFLRILRRKAKEGVHVVVMTTENSDVLPVKYAGRYVYDMLLRCGVEIYEYRKTVLHAKTTLIDGKISIVGSTNMDYRSFLHNYELDVVIDSKDLSVELAGQWQQDLLQARKLDLNLWRKRAFYKKVIEKFFYFFRYYL